MFLCVRHLIILRSRNSQQSCVGLTRPFTVAHLQILKHSWEFRAFNVSIRIAFSGISISFICLRRIPRFGWATGNKPTHRPTEHSETELVPLGDIDVHDLHAVNDKVADRWSSSLVRIHSCLSTRSIVNGGSGQKRLNSGGQKFRCLCSWKSKLAAYHLQTFRHVSWLFEAL